MLPIEPQEMYTISENNCPKKQTVKEEKTEWISTHCCTHWREVLAEFLATSFLVFFGCMGLCKLGDGEKSSLHVPLVFGIVVAMNLQIFGHISGAHMNPVVSLAAVIFGRISLPLMLCYILAQCSGAVFGFGLLEVILPQSVKVTDMCSTIPRSEFNISQSLAVEILLTSMLILVCCGIWDGRNKDRHDSVPIRFGLIVTGLAMVGGPLSGASMNPARSLGPAVWNSSWENHWIYWTGPFIGGSFSATLYTWIWKPKVLE